MNPSETQLRLFIAAALPPDMLSYFTEAALNFDTSTWRIIPKENLHLTLLFLGSTPAEKLPEIKKALTQIATEQTAFTLTLKQIEAGPSARAPRLIWARFGNNPEFEMLAKKLQQTLAPQVSLPKDLIPHVTLARRKKDAEANAGAKIILPLTDQKLMVSEMGIWQSVLGSPHPAYHVLERFALVKPSHLISS